MACPWFYQWIGNIILSLSSALQKISKVIDPVVGQAQLLGH